MARVLMKGCEAIAEAAVRAGCRFFAGYPITPQNEIPEYFSRRLPEVGGTFVQGESEVASVNMVYGAASARNKIHDIFIQPGNRVKERRHFLLRGSTYSNGVCKHLTRRPRRRRYPACTAGLFPGYKSIRKRRI